MESEVNTLKDLLEQAVNDTIIECPNCSSHLEPDAEKCSECGWKNLLRILGLI